jgi:hypothetical protein
MKQPEVREEWDESRKKTLVIHYIPEYYEDGSEHILEKYYVMKPEQQSNTETLRDHVIQSMMDDA